MQDLVVIDDNILRSMINDQRYLASFPCLQGGKKAFTTLPQRCNRCAKKQRKARNEALEQLRGCIANLDGVSRTTLKKMLKTKKVRIVYKRGGGKRIQLTF